MRSVALPAGSLLLVLAAFGLGACAVADVIGASNDCSLVDEGTLQYHGRSNTQTDNFQLLGVDLNTPSTGVTTIRLELGVLENLCVAAPESHNTVSFDLTTTAEGSGITATGRAQPAYGYSPYSVTLTRENGTHLKGTISNIGLRQGSQDGKRGYADLDIFIRVPTLHADSYTDFFWMTQNVVTLSVSYHFERLSPN